MLCSKIIIASKLIKKGFRVKLPPLPQLVVTCSEKRILNTTYPFIFPYPPLKTNKVDCTSPKDILSEKPFRYFSSSARWTKLLSKITGISCIKTSSSWLSQLNDNETHVIFRVVPKAPKYKYVIHRNPKGQLWSFHIIYQTNCKLDKNLRIINFILHCSLGDLEGNYFAIF